jgi:prephenate dehydrogenase
MAGTEHKGFENSFEGLFKGASWVITNQFNISQLKIQKLLDVINYLEAKAVFTSAKEHDEAVALISHMPMVVAQALMLTAKDNPLALEIASSGFRDMTRLALSNEEMACDMVSMNHKNIELAILKLYKSIGELTNDNYSENIAQLKAIRSKMFI